MRLLSTIVLLGLSFALVPAEAGIGRAFARGASRSAARSVGRSVRRQAARRSVSIRARDLWNHQHTKPVPLKAPRTVFRYTSPAQARKELKWGVAPSRHMTATGGPGRPLS